LGGEGSTTFLKGHVILDMLKGYAKSVLGVLFLEEILPQPIVGILDKTPSHGTEAI
jgi:hypothetical protein